VCLIGTQNLFTLVAALWDSVASPFLRVTDLLAAFLAHVSSGAIALSFLLWSPCQLALELLASVTELCINIIFVNIYGLGLLFPIVVAVLTLGMAMTSPAWRRLVDWSLQVTNWSRGGRTVNRESNQRGAAVPQARPALSRSAGQRLQPPRGEPSTSWGKAPRRQQLNAAAGDGEGASDNDPWMLLKEQEERKKCVICQDQTKTVLLLPCRHLCLCQECTEVLLQQSVYQRNCPLCRQMILQTLNVYL
ncbi:RING finger protein 26, partial [Balearica regulorum gibbericeps]